MEPRRPGARAGVMCVVMLSGECGGGEAGHNWETLYNVNTDTAQEEPDDQFDGRTPDPQLIRRCSTPSRKTINNPSSSSDILLSAPLPPPSKLWSS